MLSLQLCFRIKANLANCLQPNFPRFIHSSFPVPVVWGRHWKPHDYPNNSEDFEEHVLQRFVLIPDVVTSFLSCLKKTDLVLFCKQATSTAMPLLQCENLPLRAPASASLLTSQDWMAEICSLMSRCSASNQTGTHNRMGLLPKTLQSLFSVERLF